MEGIFLNQPGTQSVHGLFRPGHLEIVKCTQRIDTTANRTGTSRRWGKERGGGGWVGIKRADGTRKLGT